MAGFQNKSCNSDVIENDFRGDKWWILENFQTCIIFVSACIKWTAILQNIAMTPLYMILTKLHKHKIGNNRFDI